MADAYRRTADVTLTDPVLVVAMEGWIDAGTAALTAMTTLVEALGARTFIEFDGDEFVDYRARRPIVRLRDGRTESLTWPRIDLMTGQDRNGTDVVLLTGPEPDSKWKLFLRTVGGLIEELGVRLVVILGAYPAGVPHTRPSRVVGTSTDEVLARRVGVVRATLDLPAGLPVALEHGASTRGIPALSLWAQVPHYAAGMSYPGGALALIEALNRVAGLTVATDALQASAAMHIAQLDRLVANSEEHTTMLQQLERQWEVDVPDVDRDDAPGSGSAPGAGGADDTPLPSGDELAAELERYLREQGGSSGS